jgi:uncharacterized repeat protein (TIGR02543 family)
MGQTLQVNDGIYNNGTIINYGSIIATVVVPIIFEENGGTIVSDLAQDFNTALTLPTTTKNGFDFVGWFTDPELNDLFTITVMPLNGGTLYAKWQLATSITPNHNELFEVYPNPSTGYIYVKVGNNLTRVTLYDLNGSIMVSEEITEKTAIDISSLAKGVYTLKANGKTAKVVKQ